MAAQRAADLLLLDQARKQDTWLDDVPAARRQKNSEGPAAVYIMCMKYEYGLYDVRCLSFCLPSNVGLTKRTCSFLLTTTVNTDHETVTRSPAQMQLRRKASFWVQILLSPKQYCHGADLGWTLMKDFWAADAPATQRNSLERIYYNCVTLLGSR